MDSKVILFIAALIVAVIYLLVDNNRRRRERIEKKLESSWGKPSTRKITDDEMKVISHYYEDSIENSGADSGYIDGITWNDLDMDRIYKKMNIANSSVGQESLYKMLRIPSDIKKLKETDRLASFFASDKEKRKSVQRIFCWLGFSKGVSVSDYISLLSDLKPGHPFLLVEHRAAILNFNSSCDYMLHFCESCCGNRACYCGCKLCCNKLLQIKSRR